MLRLTQSQRWKRRWPLLAMARSSGESRLSPGVRVDHAAPRIRRRIASISIRSITCSGASSSALAVPMLTGHRPAVFDRDVLAFDEAHVFQALTECTQPVPGSFRRCGMKKPDHRQHWLLRARPKRPRRSHAADKRDELAALHSITSSARASSVFGTVRPSVLAVCRLMTSSNFVGRRIGRSAGFSPLRMRPA